MSQTRRPLPPRPPLPRLLQTMGFMFGGVRFLEACRRRYGGAVTLRTMFDQGFVMVFEPELAKDLCARMKVECKLISQDWDGMMAGLQAGKFDVIMDALSITADRQKVRTITSTAPPTAHSRSMAPPYPSTARTAGRTLVLRCST